MKINEVTKKIEPSKPRNFVAKNAIQSGAGAHKDKKKEAKQGKEKHKGKSYEMDVSENFDEYQAMIHKIETAMYQLHQSGRSVEEIGQLAGKIADHLRIDFENDQLFPHAFEKAYNNFSNEIEFDSELDEDDSMKIKAVSGNDVTIDQGGQEIKTTTDALAPGETPGTFTMKPADPNAMKPGATVTTATSEELEDEPMAIAPDDQHIHGETDVDLIGSGHNHDIGGDPADSFIDQVRDKGFERAQRGGREGFAGRTKMSENDELAKMLTIAGLK